MAVAVTFLGFFYMDNLVFMLKFLLVTEQSSERLLMFFLLRPVFATCHEQCVQ